VNILPAGIEHAVEAGELLYATMGSFADAALGMGDHDLCLNALRALFIRPNNRFSLDRAHMIRKDGQVAGLLLAFPGHEIHSRNLYFILQGVKVYGFRDYLRLILNYFQVFAAKETENDEFYIAHLAVSPEFRRSGFAKMMLACADQAARDANLKKVSLLVEIGNDAAIELYQQAGFVTTHTLETPGLEKKFHSPGYHRMVKTIQIL
jgi:ribosomal protein S18 acetylase RimI-like enzyme